MSFATYAGSTPSRLGDDGSGLHIMYYRNYALAVAKADPLKRSKIRTSQTVGAWVPASQQRNIYSDKFYASTELNPVKCIFKNAKPCTYSAVRTHYYDPLLSAEDFSRSGAAFTAKELNSILNDF